MPSPLEASTASGHSLNTSAALEAAQRPVAGGAVKQQRLIVAGATGALGNEVLRRLTGSGRYSRTEVLAREPITTGLSQVSIQVVNGNDPARWDANAPQGSSPQAVTGVVMFEPPRLYYDRERALWTPEPAQLLELAKWLRRCGVKTLVVVVPHEQGRLPAALKLGLATLDEQGVSAMDFERVLFVRSARKPVAASHQNFLQRTAAWMLSTLHYMVPASEQPVRPTKLAEFIEAALRVLPAGTHVAAPELLWAAGQSYSGGAFSPPKTGAGSRSDIHSLVQAWLNTSRL